MLLTRSLINASRNFPQKTAVIHGKHRFTYEQFANRVSRVKQSLKELGISKGDRIALLMLNDHRFLELLYGATAYGAVIVPVNTRLNPKEIAYILNETGVSTLYIHREFIPMIPELCNEVKTLRDFILAEDEDVEIADTGKLISYEQLLARQQDEPLSADHVQDDDTAGIYYTGGTTGRPKGVMLSHKNLVSTAYIFALAYHYSVNDIYLHAAPMFHLADAGNSHCITLLGGTHAMIRSFAATEVLKAYQEIKPTCGVLVPTMINMLLNHPEFDQYDVSSLQRIVYGGSSMPSEVLKKASIKLPMVQFIEGYGMTESTAALACLSNKNRHILEGGDTRKLASCGQPVSGVEAKIVNEDGQEAGVGEIGEIIARGPNMMKGYWNFPDATKSALRDGWYYTGDMAYRDEDNYFYIVDRAKDMIITGAENVYSIEVENVLYQHDAVLECAVIGVPDEQWGEAVTAVIVLKQDVQSSPEEIKDFARRHLANYKVPKKVELVAELPKSGPGKILKRELRDRFWKGLERKM